MKESLKRNKKIEIKAKKKQRKCEEKTEEVIRSADLKVEKERTLTFSRNRLKGSIFLPFLASLFFLFLSFGCNKARSNIFVCQKVGVLQGHIKMIFHHQSGGA